jgi:iron complex outermembrane receptor protein
MELKQGIGKKLSVGGGLRVENFGLTRKTTVATPKSNNYFNLFPSLNAIYRFNPDMNLIATYARKIGIPSYSQFDPNNSGYYDTYNSTSGNPLLDPNFFSNIEVKFSVFDYLQLSVNYSHSQTLNISELVAEPNSLQSVQTFRTYHNVNVMSQFFSLPLPFGIFKEGLAFFDKAIDIDKINFLYLYTERTKTSISGMEYTTPNKATWNHGLYSQFILPLGIRMNVEYYITLKGTYQIYLLTKPRSAMEVVFTKDFFDKKLKTSLSFEDVFNTYQTTVEIAYPNINIANYSKDDTRIIWFKVSYAFGKYEKPASEGLNIEPGGGMDGLLK